MNKKPTDWNKFFNELEKLKEERQEQEAEIAVMRDALIQALYALEALKDTPGEWNDLTERALSSVNWVLSSDAGHEFLDSYVRMQKALVAIKAHQLLGNTEVPEESKGFH